MLSAMPLLGSAGGPVCDCLQSESRKSVSFSSEPGPSLASPEDLLEEDTSSQLNKIPHLSLSNKSPTVSENAHLDALATADNFLLLLLLLFLLLFLVLLLLLFWYLLREI